jgi:hypothetical protein
MFVFDLPDSSVTNRVNLGLVIPRPGTEWKVMICPGRERPGEERNNGGVMHIPAMVGALGPGDIHLSHIMAPTNRPPQLRS